MARVDADVTQVRMTLQPNENVCCFIAALPTRAAIVSWADFYPHQGIGQNFRVVVRTILHRTSKKGSTFCVNSVKGNAIDCTKKEALFGLN
jgi:hypothetical protein